MPGARKESWTSIVSLHLASGRKLLKHHAAEFLRDRTVRWNCLQSSALPSNRRGNPMAQRKKPAPSRRRKAATSKAAVKRKTAKKTTARAAKRARSAKPKTPAGKKESVRKTAKRARSVARVRTVARAGKKGGTASSPRRARQSRTRRVLGTPKARQAQPANYAAIEEVVVDIVEEIAPRVVVVEEYEVEALVPAEPGKGEPE